MHQVGCTTAFLLRHIGPAKHRCSPARARTALAKQPSYKMRRTTLLLLAAACTARLSLRKALTSPTTSRKVFKKVKRWSRRTTNRAEQLTATGLSELGGLLFAKDPHTDDHSLAANVKAGLATAVAVAPEALQFALIAGVHPLVGLGSTLVVGLNCALFGGRPGMVSGASATCALVVAPLGKTHPEAIPTAVISAGVTQMAVGLLRGGRLVRMLPHPVVLGFVNGLAVKVIVAQVDHFQFPHGTWLAGRALWGHSFLVVLSFGVIEGAPRSLTKWAPAPLLAMLACLGASKGTPGVPLLRDVVGAEAFAGGAGALKYAFPAYTLRSWRLALPYAGELAAVGLLQSLLTLQLVDGLTRGNKYGRGRASRECRALGLGNLLSGLCGGVGGCGLLGQSLVNVSCGGTGRTSALAYVAFVLFGLVYCGQLLGSIPIGALVGLMLAVARHTFSWSSIRLLKDRRCSLLDALTIIGVSLLTVKKGLMVAVVVGICATALRFCWETANDLYSAHEEGVGRREIEMHGTLFFGSAAAFANHVAPTQKDRLYGKSWRRKVLRRTVVIDFQQCRVADASAVAAIDAACRAYGDLGVTLVLRHLSSDARTLLRAAAVYESRVLEENTEDPVYDVADDIPVPIKAEQVLANRAPRADTVVVKPPDRKTVVVPSLPAVCVFLLAVWKSEAMAASAK